MTAIFWTLTSCSCSSIGIEMHSKQLVGSSFSLLSFVTFLFMTVVTLGEHPEFLWTRRLPWRAYFQLVIIFFVVTLLNNRVLGFGLPFPLIIIFRSSTLITNVLLTWLLQNRSFSLGRLFSVLLVSIGIALFTLCSHRQSGAIDGDWKEEQAGSGDDRTDQQLLIGQRLNFVLGVFMLICSAFASAYLGIVQEKVFMRYGKHPEEMMFFVHFLSLPFFAFVSSEIQSDFALYASSTNFPVPFLSLIAILFLQLFCVRSVYRLAAETTSLQVSMTLALRKFLNILFSILIFKNDFALGHAIATGCVLLGSFTFYDGFLLCWHKIQKRKSA